MFYTFRQNNSGGSFIREPGIAEYVIIEADNENEAISRAEYIGLYFNGVCDGIDCPCCGDRWDEYCDECEYPAVYDTPVNYEKKDNWPMTVVVHYKNGKIEYYKKPKVKAFNEKKGKEYWETMPHETVEPNF